MNNGRWGGFGVVNPMLNFPMLPKPKYGEFPTLDHIFFMPTVHASIAVGTTGHVIPTRKTARHLISPSPGKGIRDTLLGALDR